MAKLAKKKPLPVRRHKEISDRLDVLSRKTDWIISHIKNTEDTHKKARTEHLDILRAIIKELHAQIVEDKSYPPTWMNRLLKILDNAFLAMKKG